MLQTLLWAGMLHIGSPLHRSEIIGAHAQQLITTTTTTTTTTLSAPRTTGAGTAGSISATSLYIPGFDPQPVSADVLGVDGDGRTTWALHGGSVGTDTASFGDFQGTATLVEGAGDASLTYANADAGFTVGMQCGFSESTVAVCTVEAQGATATQTEVVVWQPIQAGGTLFSGTASSTALTPSTNPGTPTSPTSSSSSSTSAAATESGAAPSTVAPTSSSISGSPGIKWGSATLCSVWMVLPCLVWGPRLFLI